MELVARNKKQGWVLPALMLMTLSTPLFAQEQVVEYGRIVQADDGTGSMDYLIGSGGESLESEDKAWLPILSPVMIRLDCWITRMVNIHEFYSQQAADEYFAMAENCADMPLSMDPNIYQNTGLKYTVLSPIYAWCPGMMNRRSIFGGCGGFGIPAPMPTVAGMNVSGPGVGGSAYVGSPTAPPMNSNLQPMPPSEPTMREPMGMSSSSAPVPPRQSGQVASSGGKWSQMSDAQILAHFGLDPSIAARAKQVADMDAVKLEQPVVASEAWQFAEEAPTISIDRQNMVALNHDSFPPKVEPLQLPEPIVVKERVVSKPVLTGSSVVAQPEIELEFEDQPATGLETSKEFSTTDSEYEKMKSIEKDLLGF